jgi:hypothetical protein
MMGSRISGARGFSSVGSRRPRWLFSPGLVKTESVELGNRCDTAKLAVRSLLSLLCSAEFILSDCGTIMSLLPPLIAASPFFRANSAL